MQKISFYYLLLLILPKKFISQITSYIFSIKKPKILAFSINRIFVWLYKIDMDDAEFPLSHYACLEELFSRKLRKNLRPIAFEKDLLVSPSDGFLGKMGTIDSQTLIQTKGKYYNLKDLCKEESISKKFVNGFFLTIYLSPRDYHRFHMPLDAKIIETLHIQGSLWPVNKWGVENISNLFSLNERLISVMELGGGKYHIAHIAVGAFNVGKVHLNYLHNRQIKIDQKISHSINLKKGEELGKFMFGSTIILLLEKDLIKEVFFKEKSPLKFGEPLARIFL